MIRRYEELLNLSPNSLVAVVDMINRYLSPTIKSAPLLERTPAAIDEVGERRLTTLLDKIDENAVITGHEWDELTANLAQNPSYATFRTDGWDRMAERLLSEMIVATDRAWVQRFEAYSRLLSHPRGQQPAIAACGALGADPTNQVFIDVISVLDASPHPDASLEVLRQLTNPTNDRAFYAALLACPRKSQLSHFGGPELRRLVPLLRELQRSMPTCDPNGRLAAQILSSLRCSPPSAGTGDGRLAAETVEEVIVSRLVTGMHPITTDGRDLLDDDLPVLLRELLFSPVFDVRMLLVLMFRVSPYRERLADGLAAELARFKDVENTALLLSLINAMRMVAAVRHVSVFQLLVDRPDLPIGGRVAAARALGHLDETASNTAWQEVASVHVSRWRTCGDEASAEILGGLTHGLGISDTSILDQLSQAGPASVRAAAQWWHNVPTIVRTSAQS